MHRYKEAQESFWHRHKYDLMLVPFASVLVLGVAGVMISWVAR